MNTIVDRYLNELFGFSIKHTSKKEKGEEIYDEVKKENDKKMKEDFEKKCGKLPLDSTEREICELKNLIFYLNELVIKLQRNQNKCPNDTRCLRVISDAIFNTKKEIKKYNDDLKELQKIQSKKR